MKRWWVVLAVLSALLMASAGLWLWKKYPGATSEEPLPVPPGVVFKPNLPYCQAGDQTLALDWAEPLSRDAARPAVVLIHGGAWMFGKRQELRSLQFMLAQEGFVAISVDYRLAPQAVFPQPLHDVQCAVRWLRAQASTQAIAPDRISAWGHSAGAHLAALLAVTGHRADLQGAGHVLGSSGLPIPQANTSSQVHAVVAHSGIYDLVAALEPKEALLQDARRGAIAMAGGGDSESLKRVSVATYAHAQAAPVLVLHGDQDTVAPLSQALHLHDALQAQGGSSQLLVVPGAGHNDLGSQATRVLAEVLTFLKQVHR